MKKIISIFLAVSMLTASCQSVLALEKNPLLEVIDVELFDKEGTEYDREAYQEWLEKAMPEVLGDKILGGNYGFVADCDYFWNKDKREKMSKPAKWIDEKINIPSDLAKELFGVSAVGEYISVEEIAKKVTKYKTFTDPRGFALITEDLSVIDKSPAIAGNIGSRHYRSYYDVSICIANITWEDVELTSDDFAKMRKNITDNSAIADGVYDAAYVENEIKTAKNSMSLFNKSGYDPIFAENPSIKVMYHYYQVLLQWSRTYYILKKTEKNDIDREELKSCIETLLRYLYDNSFGLNAPVDSNWYYNRISYPMFVGVSLCMMYDELPKEDIELYAKTMLVRAGDNLVSVYCVPFDYYTNGSKTDATNAYSNYTNLLWQTYTNLVLCAVLEDSPRANHTIKYANQAFEQVKNGADVPVGLLKDGVYEDGSFIFHAWYAYNLGYGNSYACTLADLILLTEGTPVDVQKTYKFENVYSWVEKSWLPFIHANRLVHIVQGRENPNMSAYSLLIAIMIMATSSGDEEVKADIAAMLKPLVTPYMDTFKNLAKNGRLSNFSGITYPMAQELIDDFLDDIEALPEKEIEPVSDVYYNMDKVVHTGKDYKFMLSMASERIDRYEAINGDGYTDWHISDGMTYLLQDDNTQYVGQWWDYVDRYMLPGTTADKNYRNPKYSSYGTVMPDNKWAGAATDGKVTVASQQLTGNASDRTKRLEAWKSYFMLEDKIICLGTGINGGDGEVSTIVENVLLQEKPGSDNAVGDYSIGYEDTIVDGQLLDVDFDTKKSFENPNWAWIEGNRGFIFLGDNNVVSERVAENKLFAGRSEANKNQAKNKPFMTLYIDHGKDVQSGKYAYAIIPNATKEETQSAAINPGFEIISQTDSLHAVRDTETGTVLASVMKPSEVAGFKFMTPCCAVIKPDSDGNYEVFVSDPNQTQKTIKVQVPEGKAVSGEYIKSINGNTVEVKVDYYYGKSYSFTAGNGSAEVKIAYDENDYDRVIISGINKTKPGDKVTLSVFKKGKTYADLIANTKDEKDALAYLEVIYSNGDGEWSTVWKPEKSGEYDFYLSRNHSLASYIPDTITISAGLNEKNIVLDDGTVEEIAEAFEDETVLISFCGDKKLAEKVEDIDKLAKNVVAIRDGESNIDASEYVKLAVLMTILGENPDADVLDALLCELSLKDRAVSAMDIYEKNATEAIKENLAERFDGCTELDIDAFDEEFTENLILAGVYKANNWSDAKAFLELLEDSDYKDNPSKVAKEVVGNDYTMDELLDAISDAAKESKGSSGGSSGGGGGGSSRSTPSITVNVPEEVQKPQATETEPMGMVFEDVSESHWAYDYINQLRWDNIVSGDEKGNFNPDNNITRAEAVKILCSAFSIEPSANGAQAFTDVTPDKWYYGYVNSAYMKKLVNGTTETEFSPDNQITRQELSVLIYRFMNNNGYGFGEAGEIDLSDADLISEYAKEAASALYNEKIISGTDDSRFAPFDKATRAQTAVMISKAMKAGSRVSK